MDELANLIREDVLRQMDLSRELQDEEIQHLIARETSKNTKGRNLSIHERFHLEKQIFDSLRKLDVLQDLVDDPEVTEIMVNGPNHIFYEKNGTVYESEKSFTSNDKLMDLLQQIVADHNRVVNQSSPIVATRLADGSRVHIVLEPIALGGAAITIRRFPKTPITMTQLIAIRSISKEAAEFLGQMVKARYNIFISGGTSSGKTTFLNALSQYIPSDERVITIEDSAELQIIGIKNLVRLETRNSNMEGVQEISIRDLIRTSLRMRPDRIIVGECRGAETLDMLQSMNCGHDGSLSTGHSNSSKDMLSRMETMVMMAGMELPLLAIRQQIASGIDIIVHLARLRDRSRRVMEISEIDGIQNGEIQMNPIFLYTSEGLVKVGNLKHLQKMQMAGFHKEECFDI